MARHSRSGKGKSSGKISHDRSEDEAQHNTTTEKNDSELDEFDTEVLTDDDEPVTKIIHISDIHIQKTDGRKKEYDEVIEKFGKLLKKEVKSSKGKCIVVCTGDVFDTGTYDLSTYPHDTFNNFFYMITSMTDFLVIPGNHDNHGANDGRTDRLRPFIRQSSDAKNKGYLLHENKYYVYNDIIFTANQFDCDHIAPPCSEMDDKFKIALYHGIVKNAKDPNIKYDKNWFVKRNKKTVSTQDFYGHDAVMLGDIHLAQKLKSNIAYAGSLLQVRSSEKSSGHGFMVWELMRKGDDKICKCKFVEVKNRFAKIGQNELGNLTHEQCKKFKGKIVNFRTFRKKNGKKTKKEKQQEKMITYLKKYADVTEIVNEYYDDFAKDVSVKVGDKITNIAQI